MENQAVIAKIAKLLALANSDNEHEARLASDKANELLLRHNLSRQDISQTEIDRYTNDILAEGIRRQPLENKLIGAILTKHFFVSVIVRRFRNQGATVCMIGKESNVQVARFVHDFLSRSFPQLWKAYRQQTGCGAAPRNSYYFGLYKGLDEQLSATRRRVETETGLVVVPDAGLELFARKEFPRLRDMQTRVNAHHADAVNSGMQDGRNLRIQRGLGGSAENRGLYLKRG